VIDDSNTNPVVAALPKRSPHPYLSIALSPHRKYAVAACKDTLQILRISPSGLQTLKNIPMAQHFSATTTASGSGAGTAPGAGGGAAAGARMGGIHEDATVRDSFVLDAFGLGHYRTPATATAGGSAHHHPSAAPVINVVITDVAWSAEISVDPSATSSSGEKAARTRDGGAAPSDQATAAKEASSTTTSLIAAAGSNGVIVVWNASSLLSEGGVATGPEAVLSQVRTRYSRQWISSLFGFISSS